MNSMWWVALQWAVSKLAGLEWSVFPVPFWHNSEALPAVWMRHFRMCCICNCRVWTHYWQQGRMGKKLYSNAEIICLHLQSPELSPLPELPFQELLLPNHSCLPGSCPSRKAPEVPTAPEWYRSLLQLLHFFTGLVAFNFQHCLGILKF